jgi:hypothetical protein
MASSSERETGSSRYRNCAVRRATRPDLLPTLSWPTPWPAGSMLGPAEDPHPINDRLASDPLVRARRRLSDGDRNFVRAFH